MEKGNDMKDERVFLSPEQAIALLPEGDEIHTFRQGGATCLLGAGMSRKNIIAESGKGCPRKAKA